MTINLGLEGWFSERVRNVVGNSLAAAEAYQQEQERNLIEDAQAVANLLVSAREQRPTLSEGDMRSLLSQAQGAIQRGLRVAFIIDFDGALRLRGERSYLFDFINPAPEDLRRAAGGELALVKDWPSSEFRALVPLPGYPNRLLYVTRAVDGEILSLLDDTQQTIALYNQLEAERGTVLFNFALLYIGFALILILAAVWLGMWFAEGLSRPIGRLAAAAERVGKGDLEVQVPEEKGGDEIATMGRVFNQMTRQLQGQRETLLTNNRQIEERRRLFDSVLGSVTAGVIGLDAEGHVDFVNRAAEALTKVSAEEAAHRSLAEVVPEFGALLSRLQSGEGRLVGGRVQDEVRISRNGRLESLLVRLAERRNAAGQLEGYVVAFDDVTELVSAQRMAAWGDVARRIAHEIKNPLTPIQLSAERLRRRYRSQVADDVDVFDRCTETIIRQVGDIGRMVDEFSSFARMPAPRFVQASPAELLREAVFAQRVAVDDIEVELKEPLPRVAFQADRQMVAQALTNILKNAGESVAARRAMAPRSDDVRGVGLRASLETSQSADGTALISFVVEDDGVGLPKRDRDRLTEPYVTTRDKGTGLGLAIVKRICEDHGGELLLADAETLGGARISLVFPLKPRAQRGPESAGATAPTDVQE